MPVKPSPTAPPAPDWGVGNYEHTAAQLLPAARVAVDRAAPAAGERVVDVGTGTGNAALLAAERGARVTGVDPAARLLGVARAEAAARGLEADFVAGDASALPLGDGDADLVLSVFGVVFAPDAAMAASELARVTSAHGRIVLTAWAPGDAIGEMMRLAREAVARAVPASGGEPPFPWHDRDALTALLGPHGFTVDVQEHELSFAADSPRDFLDGEGANHPLAVGAGALLEPHGELEALRERMLAVLEAANEHPAGFRVTRRYAVVTARRP